VVETPWLAKTPWLKTPMVEFENAPDGATVISKFIDLFLWDR
jgi:hypothetical protein